MDIEFSDHSKSRNKIRKIPLNKIKETISNPDQIVPSFKERLMYRKKYGTKTLEVVTIKEKSIITVITQYYLK